MVKLSVNIGRLKLRNPVMPASGTFGPEYGDLTDINSLGAYVAKTITLKPRTGNPPPRLTEVYSGLLNSIGLENKGLEDFLKNKLPLLRRIKIPIIASIAGDSEEEFRILVKALSGSGRIAAIELNLSCPNVKHASRDRLTAQDPEAVEAVVRVARKATDLTLIAKLSPCVTDIASIAHISEKAGADAVLVANTFPAMAVDIETKKPQLGNVTGGLSGPAIKPIALKMVRDTYRKVSIPVVASGGIMSYKDAVEFMLCGASAVQIGTASFTEPRTAQEIVSGIKDYMKKQRVDDIGDLIGGIEK